MKRRLLIVGCGDVGRRLIPFALVRYRVYALSRESGEAVRALGAVPITADLDQPQSLSVISGIAHDVVHLAPPPAQGVSDTRTAHLIAALGKTARMEGSLPRHFVYISTSGVYGDCAGEVVPETRPARPQTARARRRVDAERRLRAWGVRTGVRVSILRVPGIYAQDRLPLARLQRGTPAILDAEDGYVNHVHADDLARMVMAALIRAKPGRAYNAVDDAPQKMGAYFDLVADRHGLQRPPRIARSDARRLLPEALLSFMSESRRLSNERVKRELRFRLRYPTVRDGVTHVTQANTR